MAIVLFVPGLVRYGPRSLRVMLAALAPIVLFAASDLGTFWDIRSIAVIVASLLAWIPFWLELGGRVPVALWTLPIVLVIVAAALSGPWALSILISDIAARAQVLLLAGVALVVHAISEHKK